MKRGRERGTKARDAWERCCGRGGRSLADNAVWVRRAHERPRSGVTQCGAVDWLPPTGALEWSYRPGVTAVRSGTLAAWLMWYVRWTARERVEDRRRWAAWRARAGRY
eukprot:1505488-Prymnesium_polylepis.1